MNPTAEQPLVIGKQIRNVLPTLCSQATDLKPQLSPGVGGGARIRGWFNPLLGGFPYRSRQLYRSQGAGATEHVVAVRAL